MDENIKETVMTDEEFNELLSGTIAYLAEIGMNPGLWEMPERWRELEKEMERRGIQPLLFGGDERVNAKIRQIKEEKAQKRENDPEGYQKAKEEYTRLIKEAYERRFADALGRDDLKGKEDIRIIHQDPKGTFQEEWERVTEELYAYEDSRRDAFWDVEQLKHKVYEQRDSIISDSSGEKKLGMEDVLRQAVEAVGLTIDDFVAAKGQMDAKDHDREVTVD